MAFKVGTGDYGESDPVSPGVHDAVVCEVFDLGERWSKFHDSQKEHRGIFSMQVAELRTDGQFAGQRKELWFFFNVTAGIGNKTNLKRFLEGWRGKPFAPEELQKIGADGYDLEVCNGKALQVLVSHKIDTSGKTRAKVEAALPPNKDKAARLLPFNYEPISKRQMDLDAIFGKRVEPEHPAAGDDEGQPVDDNDDIPF